MCISAILFEQCSMVLSATNTDFGTTETRSLTTSLISTSARLLKTIMREERPVLLELQDLFRSFHLYHTLSLVFQVCSFCFFIVDQRFTFPDWDPINKRMDDCSRSAHFSDMTIYIVFVLPTGFLLQASFPCWCHLQDLLLKVSITIL